MDVNKISIGSNPPNEVNVIVEIPGGSSHVKYELDKESGVLMVDRFMMGPGYQYPYGFIPHTLSGDGDPCDVVIVVDMSLVPGCVVKARPIGVLMTEDEQGTDEKILAVPVNHSYYENIKSYEDLPRIIVDKIAHFFESYKALEKGKWVKVKGWGGLDKALSIIEESINRFKEQNN